MPLSLSAVSTAWTRLYPAFRSRSFRKRQVRITSLRSSYCWLFGARDKTLAPKHLTYCLSL